MELYCRAVAVYQIVGYFYATVIVTPLTSNQSHVWLLLVLLQLFKIARGGLPEPAPAAETLILVCLPSIVVYVAPH